MDENKNTQIPEDAKNQPPLSETSPKSVDEDENELYEPTLLEKFREWYTKNTKRNTLVLILVLILVFFAVPKTRYWAVGFVIKKPVKIVVLDNKFNLPVSGAVVTLGGESASTNAEGVVEFEAVPVGSKKVAIIKPYYADYSLSLTNPIKGKLTTKIKITPEGKQAPVIIIDKTTRQPVAGARVASADTFVITDGNGEAYISLPDASKAVAEISARGYKIVTVDLTLNHLAFAQNTFELEVE